MTVTVMGKADLLLFPQNGHPTSGKTIEYLQALLGALGAIICTGNHGHTEFSSGSEAQRQLCTSPKCRPCTQLVAQAISPLPLRDPLCLPAGSGSGEVSASSGGPAAAPGVASWFQ